MTIWLPQQKPLSAECLREYEAGVNFDATQNLQTLRWIGYSIHTAAPSKQLRVALLVMRLFATLQVEKMRRSLLRLIGVGEFSSSAEWVDPCSSYVLPQVICLVCGLLKDVDLCRDAMTVEGSW